MYTWTTRHKEDWVCWDPAFKEIDDNIVYEEREDEFDIVSEEETEYLRSQVKTDEDEDEEIDVVTVDKPARSDSSDIEDDELIYLVDSEVENFISTKTLETQQPESSTRSEHSVNNIVISNSTNNNSSIGRNSKVKGKNKARMGNEYEDVNGWKKKPYHN